MGATKFASSGTYSPTGVGEYSGARGDMGKCRGSAALVHEAAESVGEDEHNGNPALPRDQTSVSPSLSHVPRLQGKTPGVI